MFDREADEKALAVTVVMVSALFSLKEVATGHRLWSDEIRKAYVELSGMARDFEGAAHSVHFRHVSSRKGGWGVNVCEVTMPREAFEGFVGQMAEGGYFRPMLPGQSADMVVEALKSTIG